MTPRLMLLPLAFALVATVTFAAAEGEEASAAEKDKPWSLLQKLWSGYEEGGT